MALGSLFKRNPAPAGDDRSGAPEDDGPVQQARVRARRRLIGAVVLLALGVVLFPLLFETQPRPLPRDIPIELARKDGAASPARQIEPPVAPVAPARVVPAPRPAPAAVTQPGDAGSEQAAVPASAASAAAMTAVVAAGVPAAMPSASAPQRVEPAAAKAAAAASEPAATASAPKVARWVVQVGAFTDAAALREARQKVEKLGMKTYTQVIETDAGKRTRVRVGPFETREEAERMGAKLKAAGMPAYILGL